MPTEIRRCELCSAAAAVHCPSDSAYLCRRCDSAVHAANFLVTRHIRSPLCSRCGDLSGDCFSGPGARRCTPDLCRSCSQCAESDVEEEEESSLSSIASSTTESSAAGRPASKDCSGEVTSAMKRRRRTTKKSDAVTEGILVNWCKKLGLDGNRVDAAVVETAGRVFERLAGVRVRVALATSFWVGLRLCCGRKEFATCRNLLRVEKITGVPAKVILALEGKMGRVVKPRGRVATEHCDCEEGWAEC